MHKFEPLPNEKAQHFVLGFDHQMGATDEISKQLLDDIEVLANLEPYLKFNDTD